MFSSCVLIFMNIYDVMSNNNNKCDNYDKCFFLWVFLSIVYSGLYVVLSLADSHSSIFVNYLENRTCSVVKVSNVGEYLDEDVWSVVSSIWNKRTYLNNTPTLGSSYKCTYLNNTPTLGSSYKRTYLNNTPTLGSSYKRTHLNNTPVLGSSYKRTHTHAHTHILEKMAHSIWEGFCARCNRKCKSTPLGLHNRSNGELLSERLACLCHISSQRKKHLCDI